MNLSGLRGVSAWFVYNRIVFGMIFLRQFNYAHNEQLAIISEFDKCNTREDYQAVVAKLNVNKLKKLSFTQGEVVTAFKESPKLKKEQMILEALTVNGLNDDDCLRLLSLHKDSNGVPYSKNNIKSMDSAVLVPLMIETLIACSNLDCDFSLLTDIDIETLGDKRVSVHDEVADTLSANADMSTSDLLSLAVKRILSRFKL